MNHEAHIAEYLTKIGCEESSVKRSVRGICTHLPSRMPYVCCSRDVESMLSNKNNVQRILQASLFEREAYTTRKSREIDGFSPTMKRSELARNHEKHATLPKNIFTYGLCTFVPDTVRHIVSREPDPLQISGAIDLFLSLPFDSRRIGNNPYQLLADTSTDLGSLPPGVRTCLKLFQSRVILALLSKARPSMRIQQFRPTARVSEIHSHGGFPRVGVYQNSSTKVLHGTRKIRKHSTNLRVFPDLETALRSQDHAIDSLEEQRVLLKGIFQGVECFLRSNAVSPTAFSDQLSQYRKDIQEKQGYWLNRIRDNLNNIFPERNIDNLGRAGYICAHATSGIRDIIAQKAEIASTKELIQSLGRIPDRHTGSVSR